MRETLIRTAVLALALTNQILTACGVNIIPIGDETVSQLVSALITVIAALRAWWKNNSFTTEARTCDALLKRLKEEKQ